MVHEALGLLQAVLVILRCTPAALPASSRPRRRVRRYGHRGLLGSGQRCQALRLWPSLRLAARCSGMRGGDLRRRDHRGRAQRCLGWHGPCFPGPVAACSRASGCLCRPRSLPSLDLHSHGILHCGWHGRLLVQVGACSRLQRNRIFAI
jgi:hypothetical protein